MSATVNGRVQKASERFPVTWDGKTPPKPQLPKWPGHDDDHSQALWVTSVFALDDRFPITGGAHQGPSDGSGHVQLTRLDAPALRFEPARIISDARRLDDALIWQRIQTDDRLYAWSNAQAKQIAQVVRLLCGSTATRTSEQETALIVMTFLEGATPPKPDEDELTTYGTAAQRYEAATALRPDLGGKRYFQDKNTGEYVIRVSDLQKMAREVYGGSIERGWLDARMEALGWERRTLDGHARPGTAGRHGPHAKVSVYRGHLPPPTDVDPLTDGEEAGDAA